MLSSKRGPFSCLIGSWSFLKVYVLRSHKARDFKQNPLHYFSKCPKIMQHPKNGSESRKKLCHLYKLLIMHIPIGKLTIISSKKVRSYIREIRHCNTHIQCISHRLVFRTPSLHLWGKKEHRNTLTSLGKKVSFLCNTKDFVL